MFAPISSENQGLLGKEMLLGSWAMMIHVLHADSVCNGVNIEGTKTDQVDYRALYAMGISVNALRFPYKRIFNHKQFFAPIFAWDV